MVDETNKEIVPSSVKSVSENISISPNREWLFYNYGEINRTLHVISEILANKPAYLLDNELEFLSLYKNDFSKHKEHNQFKLATTDYIHLLTKALESLESRLDAEEDKVIRKNIDVSLKGQLVVSFSQISSLMKDINRTFFTNFEMIKQQPSRYVKVMNYLVLGINYLLRAYVYEYRIFSKPKELSVQEMINFNSEIDRLYVDFNSQDYASPDYKVDSEVYEIYS